MRTAMEYSSSLYSRLLHPRPALTNCKSCRTWHWELPQYAHTSHTRAPTAPTPHNANRKRNIHHITSPTQTHTILQHSKAKKLFNNGRYTTNIPTVTTTDIKTNVRHIHTSIVARHLATRVNNKILRTPSSHLSSSEENSK